MRISVRHVDAALPAVDIVGLGAGGSMRLVPIHLDDPVPLVPRQGASVGRSIAELPTTALILPVVALALNYACVLSEIIVTSRAERRGTRISGFVVATILVACSAHAAEVALESGLRQIYAGADTVIPRIGLLDHVDVCDPRRPLVSE